MNNTLNILPLPLSKTSERFHEDLITEAKRYAYSFTKDWYDAEDLVQQAWLKIKNKYREVTNRGLLFRSIRNLFIDGTRRQKIIRFESLDNAYNVGTTQSFGSQSDLDEILRSLSPAEKQSLFLNIVEGYTAKEISAKTGMPRGTVLSHIHRARQKLILKFGHEFSDTPSKQSLKKAG